MEIISFVGAYSSTASSQRSSRNFKHYKSYKSPVIYSRNSAVKISARPSSFFQNFARNVACTRINFREAFDKTLRCATVAAKKTLLHIWVVPVAAFVFAVPFMAVKTGDYFSSHTSAIKLDDFESSLSEAEFLEKAMEKFALEGAISFNVSEDGEILGEKGELLTKKQLGILEPVTFQTYKVKSGESISTIAKKFGLTNISTLISINDIDNVRTLRSGQKLKIPSIDGIIHTVAKGDSITNLAKKYGCTVEQILDANDLETQTLFPSQPLFIPGGKMDAQSLKKAMGELFTMPIAAKFRYSSMFGARKDPFTGVKSNHTGVDMACPTGTPIKASQSGKVIKAGWHNTYGNYVIISHGDGYQTLYAHMSKINARQGQYVSQGTIIGLVGSTGYSTGPHLHFTVFKNGKLVDPMSILKR